ncbi:uncharacterized protein BP01DRAFT_31615 [Aspergillus saccharolyticus JOP 1030-1]|uniref:F-box domain-containing protein n=1 Tax=Aspergillus saccharolyticus JOP 1030-1 TaxID=1450539 RepID=A0A318ZEC8_9EURO|nr:hypothetical protein BP01DRAFT_31615 [Aspergillus saccharolyticus JOP 1030-1]PYH45896.1 hypothetical protein BP01DRAFT_31615 [Aspergillus saccharolyticus JOP 1030-1]
MPIVTLPNEILDTVWGFLSLQDWCALRLSCRTLYSRSLATFVSRHVQRISVLMTRDGLRELQAIAAHETFRTSVQELWLVAEVFRGHYETDYNDFVQAQLMTAGGVNHRTENTRWTAESLIADYESYQTAVADHLQLIQADSLPQILASCMKQFPHLSTVGLETYPPTAAGYKHPPCLGRNALRRQLNHHPFSHPQIASHWQRSPDYLWGEETRSLRAPVFSALLQAIPTATIQIQQLRTCSEGEHCGIPPEQLTLTDTHYEILQPHLQSLQTLDLCLQYTHHPSPVAPSESSPLLRLLLAAAPTLTTLKVSQWSTKDELPADHFTTLAHHIHFTRLTSLSLHWIEVTQPSVRAFLRTAAPTIQTLSLVSVSLIDRIDRPTRSPPFYDAVSDLWRRLCDAIRDDLPGLRSLEMKDLAYRGHVLGVEDPLRAQSGTRRTRSGGAAVAVGYDATRAQVGFATWLDQLQLAEPRSARLGQPLPGRFSSMAACSDLLRLWGSGSKK